MTDSSLRGLVGSSIRLHFYSLATRVIALGLDVLWLLNQRQLFEILRGLALGSIYCVTTVQRLAEMLQLKSPLAIAARLDNLQSLGAISGVKL